MGTELAINWGLNSHRPQLELLEQAVSKNRLSHAYIFSGPEGNGKVQAAKRLAQSLLCQTGLACDDCVHCKTFAVGSNPDFIYVDGQEGIKIESIRELAYKLSLMPYSGKQKVALVDSAHNMTTEASNALLKVLEEPKSHTLIILLTDNVYRLLPTIISRAQRINFGPTEESENFETAEGYEIFSKGGLGDKLLLASQMAELETPELTSALSSWLKKLELDLRENPTLKLSDKIRAVIRATRMIDQNVSSKLLLTELMIKSNQN